MPPEPLGGRAEEGLGRWLRVLVLGATLGAISAFCAVLVGHWRRGSRAARRILAPVVPTALLYAAVSAASILSELGAPVGLARQWLWVENLAILAVPVAFLGGLLRSRLARYGVGQLVVELGTAVGGELRSAVSRALGGSERRDRLLVGDWDATSTSTAGGSSCRSMIPTGR